MLINVYNMTILTKECRVKLNGENVKISTYMDGM